MENVPPELLARMPHARGEWRVQGGCLIAFARCPQCNVSFGLSGEPEYLASGEAKHWCRICQTLIRMTVAGEKPHIPEPLIYDHVGSVEVVRPTE